MKSSESPIRSFFVAFVLYALPLVAYWGMLRVASDLQLVSAAFSVLPHVFMTVAYVGIAIVAFNRPSLAASRGATRISIAMVPLGLLCVAVADASGVVSLLVIGVIVYAVGVCFLSLYSQVALCSLPKNLCLAAMAFAYVASRFLGVGMSHVPMPALVALEICTPFLVYALGAKLVQSTLVPYRGAAPLSHLSMLNPRSFLPLTSMLFVSFLSFDVLAGFFASRGAFGDVTFPAVLVWSAVFVAAVAFVLARKVPRAHAIFSASAFLSIAGVMCALSFSGGLESLSFELVLAGMSGCEMLIYWYIAFELGQRNSLLIVETLAWARTASDTGFTFGSLCGVGLGASAQASTGFVLVAGLAFVLVNFVAMRSFDFDKVAESIQPLRVVDPESVQVDKRFEDVLAQQFRLTERELEIYALLARGRNMQFIEKTLVISKNTVKTHVRHIYEKLGVHSQQELIDFNESHSV